MNVKRRLQRCLLTPDNGKPKAEPNTMPTRQAHPIPYRTAFGSLNHGLEITGSQKAEMGPATAVFGMKRKAITLRNQK